MSVRLGLALAVGLLLAADPRQEQGQSPQDKAKQFRETIQKRLQEQKGTAEKQKAMMSQQRVYYMLMGTWKLTAAERNGEKVDLAKEEHLPTQLSITGNRIVAKLPKDQEHKGTFKADLTKDPATIDLTPSEGPEKGKAMQGLMKVKGDTLTLCFTEGEHDKRPTELASKKDSKTVIATFKKAGDYRGPRAGPALGGGGDRTKD
jgi:uncharacterized protein (TIGR03067 family)